MRWPFQRHRRPNDDFANEIDSHIANEAERLITEGWEPEAAGYEARRRFGNVGVARERFHESRSVTWLETLTQDVRYAWRVLRRAPVFTTIAVVSLALGIGANTAVFTFVNAILLKPLPVQDPERLAWVRVIDMFPTTSYPTVVQFREQRQLFAAVAAVFSFERSNVAFDGQSADPRAVNVHLVTGDYFALFGVRAAIGRVLTMDDERAPGAHPVVVISDSYWRARLNGMSGVIGHALMLNRTAYTIVGVAPPSFFGDELGAPADLWIPIMMQSEVMPERPNILMTSRSWVRMIVRLNPGVTHAEAGERATQFYRGLLVSNALGGGAVTPKDAAEFHVTVNSEAHGYAPTREDAAQPMMVVWVIVLLVLGIACVNVSSLMLMRAAAREREITTRIALGASSMRVARLFLTEGALIGGAATVLGLAIAFAGVGWLERVAASGVAVFKLDLAPDLRVLAVTLGVSLLATLVCGVAPARRAVRLSVVQGPRGWRGGTSSTLGTRRSWLGNALVAAEVALALVLVIAAGLFGRTLAELQRQDMGFDRDHLLEAFTAPEQANIAGERLAKLYDEAAQRIGALPGVRDAVVSGRGLLSLYSGMVLTKVPGYVPKPDEQVFVGYNYTTPGFFRTAGMQLLAGRDFGTDDFEGRPRVAIISESMARHYFGTLNAIGKRYGIARDEGAPIQVVGIVRDAKDGTLRDHDVAMMYLPYRQNAARLTAMRVIVRTNGDPAIVAPAVRRVLRDLEPSLPVTAVQPIRAKMSRSIAMERFTALASAFFAGVALLLAALGVFALVSHAVISRTSEIGIRMALGGTPGGVTRLILREHLVLVCAGLAIGAGLSVVASRIVESRLFGVSPTDAVTFVAAVGVMLAAAMGAVLVPAGRATRVDPAVTLRHE